MLRLSISVLIATLSSLAFGQKSETHFGIGLFSQLPYDLEDDHETQDATPGILGDIGLDYHLNDRWSIQGSLGFSKGETEKTEVKISSSIGDINFGSYSHKYLSIQSICQVRYHYLMDKTKFDLYSGIGMGYGTAFLSESSENVTSELIKEPEYSNFLLHINAIGFKYNWDEDSGVFIELGSGAIGVARVGFTYFLN